LEANNKITKKIKDYGILLDIDMLDPIIGSDHRFYSFADEGELSPNSRNPVSWVGFLLH
jgi:DNA repair protein RadC